MLNMTISGVVSNRRWRSESEIDLSPLDSTITEAHVLAVDDNLVDRKLIEKLLRTSSCRVTAVDSGIRALEYLGLDEDHETSDDDLKVDLIITDYCMPGMTGYELLKRIKNSSNFKETPVVIMSSENVLTRVDRCLEEGAEDFILKPVKSSDVKRIKDYLSKDDRSNGRECGVNKRKERDGSDLSSDSSPPSIRPPPSDFSLSSELESLPSISSDVSPFSSSPSSPSGPLDSPSTPTSPSSPSPPSDSCLINGSDENEVVNKLDGLD